MTDPIKRKKRSHVGYDVPACSSTSAESAVESLDDQSKRIVAVRTVMNERDAARSAGNFLKSDELRDRLKDMGVFVVDQKDGRSGWRFLDGSSNKLPPGTKIPEVATKKKREEIEDLPESQHTATSKSKKQRREEKRQDNSSETARNLALLQKAEKTASAGKMKDGSRVVEGVGIMDVEVGSGEEASSGSRVRVHYVGKLKSNNKVFDASTKKPFAFRLGRGEVIRGWDVGVQGMRVGGRRTLTIPPEKAYGRHGAPPKIPGNSWLVFDVTLLGVK